MLCKAVDYRVKCDNIRMQKCAKCVAPLLCLCKRGCVRSMIGDLYREDRAVKHAELSSTATNKRKPKRSKRSRRRTASAVR